MIKLPTRNGKGGSTLEGQLLIAMPRMTDRRFQRSVIYMCAHSDQGAMGLIINQNAEHIDFPDLLERLGLVTEIFTGSGTIELPDELLDIPVHVGGPVDSGRGFVLHSSDYFVQDSTLQILDGVCLTATLDILRAMATGKGPKHTLLALGYAGWSPGQLESEIQANGWLHCPADMDLIFDADNESKYARAMAKIGIDPSHLVADAGHA
ncbi:MAG: YqgE/AlgH family protein [Hyphomicrobiaceae bacterium]|nr:YqgE/AlgH family protein [Hyphomicrobiaceae bacterium]